MRIVSSEPPSPPTEDAADLDQDWRPSAVEAVLTWSVRVGAIIAGLLLAVAGFYDPSRFFALEFLAMFGVYGGMILIQKKKNWPLEARILGFCLVLAILAALGMSQFGFAPLPPLALVLVVICAGLFFGDRSMLVALVLTSLLIGAVGLLRIQVYPLFSSQWLDPRSPGSWVRASVEYAAISGAIAALVANVVRQMERAHRRTAAALDRLRAETLKKHHALSALAESEAALLRAQKLEALGRLAAGVGHDFNNTLQVILSSASFLVEGADRRALEQGMKEIVEAAEQGRELPKRLLAFGRHEVRVPQEIQPHLMIANLMSSLRRLLPMNIELRKTLDPAGMICVDPAQFEQVLFNVVLNARDAMPEGGVLELGTGRAGRASIPNPEIVDSENWTHVWIRDNGVGIPDDVRDQIFEPFFTTKGDVGTGLGLATAYGIVRRAAGVIVVDSKVGSGTVLHLYFPEHEGAIQAVEPEEASIPEGLSVLLVEDDLAVQRGMVRVLRAAGCRVVACDRATSALVEIRAHLNHFEFLCTDGLMPGGGVPQMIEEFRACNPGADVLVCSGYLPEELLKQEITAGTLEFLAKPFLPSELVAHIAQMIQNSRARRHEYPLRHA